MSSSVAIRAASILVAVSTALVIVTAAIVPLLTPAWLGFAQVRAQATAWTGLSQPDVQVATSALVHDLVVGPPLFDVVVAGAPLLGERERAHMRDVRGVFSGLALLAGGSLVVLVVALVRARRSVRLWRAIRSGALGLLGTTVVLGAVAAVAFDQAFEIFHRLFFPGGTYTFDPRTDRLVQLFPDQLWVETSLAAGALIVAISLLIAWWADRRGASLTAGDGRPGPVEARVAGLQEARR